MSPARRQQAPQRTHLKRSASPAASTRQRPRFFAPPCIVAGFAGPLDFSAGRGFGPNRFALLFAEPPFGIVVSPLSADGDLSSARPRGNADHYRLTGPPRLVCVVPLPYVRSVERVLRVRAVDFVLRVRSVGRVLRVRFVVAISRSPYGLRFSIAISPDCDVSSEIPSPATSCREF